jgi:anti-sigma factor RsiW
MACREYEDRLNLLEDYAGKPEASGLTAAEKEQVWAHLAACAACREDVEAARAGGELLRSAFAPTGEPSAAFWFRLRAAIRTATDASARGDFWPSLEFLARRLAWTVALAVVLLAGYATLTYEAVDAQGEVREIFPELAQPSSQEEVLLTLGGNGDGR